MAPVRSPCQCILISTAACRAARKSPTRGMAAGGGAGGPQERGSQGAWADMLFVLPTLAASRTVFTVTICIAPSGMLQVSFVGYRVGNGQQYMVFMQRLGDKPGRPAAMYTADAHETQNAPFWPKLDT